METIISNADSTFFKFIDVYLSLVDLSLFAEKGQSADDGNSTCI